MHPALWGRFGTDLGPIWDRSGVDWASIWGRLEVDFGPILRFFTFIFAYLPIWDRLWIYLGAVWDPNGISNGDLEFYMGLFTDVGPWVLRSELLGRCGLFFDAPVVDFPPSLY